MTIQQNFFPSGRLNIIALSYYNAIDKYSFFMCDQSDITEDRYHNVVAIFRVKPKNATAIKDREWFNKSLTTR
jgi:hypothetical protein